MENHKNSYNTPYKFNGKEQDSETGYYYYGARYYNPRVSLWLNVDPLAVYNPVMEDEFYGDGQHNGGVYNSGNLNPYIYCYQNPVRYIDTNGKQVDKTQTLADFFKGVHMNNVYNKYTTTYRGNYQGDTRAAIVDRTLGRKGTPVVRFDKADRKTPYPHINIASPNDPHTKLPGGIKTLKGLEYANKTMDGLNKVAKPLAIGIDAYRIGNAINEDGGQIGRNTIITTTKVGAGWGGAYIGAQMGASAGSELGLLGGPYAEVTVPVGGFLGGLSGGIVGGIYGEKAVDNMFRDRRCTDCIIQDKNNSVTDGGLQGVKDVQNHKFKK